MGGPWTEAFAKKYGATFPMFSKVEVNGDGAAPLYKWMKDAKKEEGPDVASRLFARRITSTRITPFLLNLSRLDLTHIGPLYRVDTMIVHVSPPRE